MNSLKHLEKVLSRIEGWFVIVFLWAMVILTFIQVCLRALYTHAHIQWANTLMGQMDWSEPFVRLLVLWLTFMGASLVTGENRHIRIDLFGNILPLKWNPFREFILYLACIILSGIMVKVCLDYIKIEMEFGGRLFAGIPAWAGEMIIPMGFFLMFIRFIIRALEEAAVIIRRPIQ